MTAPMGSTPGSVPPKQERALRWPLFLTALLASQALVCGLVIYLATSDPSGRVEKDAYARGISWDAARAQEERLRKLGVEVSATISPASGIPLRREVSVAVREPGEAPPIAGVFVRGFAHAAAKDGYEVALVRGGDGRFAGAIPTARGGLHQLEIRFRRGEEELRCNLDVLAAEPAAAAPPTGTEGRP